MTINEAIRKMKEDWSEPRDQVAVGEMAPMAFACLFSEEAANENNFAVLKLVLPPALLQFWKITRWARLFQDCTYGQWGLEILSPTESIEETRKQRELRQDAYEINDLVVGRFIGDSDLLTRLRLRPTRHGCAADQ